MGDEIDEGRPRKSRRATPSQEERDRIAAEIRMELHAGGVQA